MSRDFDAEIRALEEKRDQLRDRMAGEVTHWLDVTAPYVGQYWLDAAQKMVKDQHEHSKEMGHEAVRNVRTEVEGLVGRAREFTQQRLVDERADKWPHLKPQTKTSEEPFSRGTTFSAFRIYTSPSRSQSDRVDPPDILEEAMKNVLYAVGDILKSHRYELTDYRWGGGGHGYTRLKHPPYWTPDMVEAMNKYADYHDEYMKTLDEIGKVRNEKGQTEAASMWGD